jgi:crotonobetainyl-CoA:carnitine CoA-transferase CaiB-like acyl-CoA transferase
MTIAGGISAALLRRERTGEAGSVDVSLLATGMWAMGASIALSLQQEKPWNVANLSMSGGGPGNPLTGIYKTSDGRFLSLVMLQGFHYWPDFCEHIDRPDLVQNELFDSHDNLTANAQAARDIITEAIAQQTLDEWTERFATLKGQWTRVQNTLEVAVDPQVRANGYMQEAVTGDGTSFELVASPVQFDEAPTGTDRSPEFNEHCDEILTELGLDMDRILELKVGGAVA